MLWRKFGALFKLYQLSYIPTPPQAFIALSHLPIHEYSLLYDQWQNPVLFGQLCVQRRVDWAPEQVNPLTEAIYANFILAVSYCFNEKKKTIEKPLVRLAWMMSIEGARSIFYCAWNQASSVSPSTCLDRLHAVCLLNSTNVWTQRNRKTEGILSTLVLLLDNWTVKLWDFPASGLLTQEKHSYQCFFLIV